MYDANMALIKVLKVAMTDSTKSQVSASYILKDGIAFVDKNYKIVDTIDYRTAERARALYALNNEEWSHTFHKSIEKVENSTIEELLEEQILHYLSTYGMESLGFNACPVIPIEKLNLDLDASANKNCITVIKIVDEKQATEYVNNYLRTVNAPNKMSMPYIKELIEIANLDPEEIKSSELKVVYWTTKHIVPKKADDALRTIIYFVTGSPLLIKSKEVINALKTASQTMENLVLKVDELECAKSFFRYKPLWLALKTKKTASKINRIRKLAEKHHKPLSDVNVMNYSKLMKQARVNEADKVLKNATSRELIKLLNFERMECSG